MTRQEDRAPAAQAICFPPFRLDLANEQLWRGTQLLAVRPKTFAVLRYLVEHPNRLVTRDELRQAVWPETVGSERAPKQCIRELRQVLGEEPATRRFIETFGRRGWRFIAPLTPGPAPVHSPGSEGQNSSSAGRLPPVATRVVGREGELERLHGWLETALQGERQVVFVTGEPGIGKTTLVDAFVSEVRSRKEFGVRSYEEFGGQNTKLRTVNSELPSTPVFLAHGQCIEQHGAGEAFLPVLDALGRLARGAGGAQLIELLRTHAPMWLVHLPAFLEGEELETLQRKVQGASRERMLREFADMVEALTTGGAPLLLVLEDLHWSDVSTLDLLAFIARRREPARLLVIGTYRPVEMLSEGHPLRGITQELYAHGLAAELALEVLSEAAVGEYVATRLRGKPSRDCEEAEGQPEPERETESGTDHPLADARGSDSWRALAHALYHRTGGNPLFLVSTVDELVAQGILTQTDNCWTLQREVADVGIAESIRHLVARLRGRLSPEEQHTLEAASVAGMEFSAAAVAAARTTETMEIERHCEQLARRQHFLRRVGVEAWPDGTLAARYGFLHALYQQLWHEHVSPTQLQQYHLRIGERKEQAYGDRYHEIAAELAVHFEQARNYRKAVQYLQQAGLVALRRHANREAIAHLTHGIALLTPLPETPDRLQQELQLQAALIAPVIMTGGYATPALEYACARARLLCQQLLTPLSLFPVLYGLHSLYMMRGQLRSAHEINTQLVQMSETAADPVAILLAQGTTGGDHMYGGAFDKAQPYLRCCLALYDPQQHGQLAFQVGHDPGVMNLCFLAWNLWFLGYPDQAVAKIRESQTLAQELQIPFLKGGVLHSVMVLFHLSRQPDKVQEHSEKILHLEDEGGRPLWRPALQIFHGWALTHAGQSGEGIAQAEQGFQQLQAFGIQLWSSQKLAVLAEAYLVAGRIEEGYRTVNQALAAASHYGSHWFDAELYRLKGTLTLQSQASLRQVSGKSQASQNTFEFPNPQALTPKQKLKRVFSRLSRLPAGNKPKCGNCEQQ